jgi:histidinol-phosphate phosphatase family protein
MNRPTQAVIFAGGRGTRLGNLTLDRPKPMVEVGGQPFLQYQLELLKAQGFSRVLLLLGYRAEVIMDYFGDGSEFGLEIQYSITEPDDLTSLRVQVAAGMLDEHFLLAYCDNYLPMSFDKMWAQYCNAQLPVQVTGYANRDGYSRSGMKIVDGRVETFDRSRTAPGLNAVEISYAIVERDAVLPLLPPRGDELFEQAVYPSLAAQGRLGGYLAEHRYYSCGDPKKLEYSERFFSKQKTIILDRDGTLNVRPPRAQYVKSPAEFQWLPGALEALSALGEHGYRIVVVSNQAGINRGAMSADDLQAITNVMMNDARSAGGPIEKFYYCPHDWDEGCLCRKPSPGMLFEAQREFDLDLTQTLFIGDDERDGEAAYAADSPFEFATEQRPLLEIVNDLLNGKLTTLPTQVTFQTV